MALKFNATIALFLILTQVLCLTFANACSYCPSPKPTTPPPAPKPKPPSPYTPSGATCPVDALKLGACANVLDLIKAKVGKPPVVPCCSLLEGLVDLEAAVCLCTAIKANILGINLNVPVDLSLVLNYCNKSCPSGFTCP